MTLLLFKVKIGVSMLVSACLAGVLLGVWPADIGRALAEEWHSQPLTRTTGYLFVSLTALLLLVNVIGVAMEEIGLSQRVRVGPLSGRSNVIFWLEQRGIEAVEEIVTRIYDAAKKSDHVLEDHEIQALLGAS